jgi:ferrous iron transport protein B
MKEVVSLGLSLSSTGVGAVDSGLIIQKESDTDKVIALAGNPNVGKSTVFNALTGLNQHTGNWPGKTVTSAQGKYSCHNTNYILVDLPGTYSLMAHSSEEEIARDFLCFGKPDVTVVVCDATCLERNLNLVLQVIEITPRVVVCVNLLDEAKKKKICVDLEKLSKGLGVPVVGTSASSKKGLHELTKCIEEVASGALVPRPEKPHYLTAIEQASAQLAAVLEQRFPTDLDSGWVALKLLDYDQSLGNSINTYFHKDITADELLTEAIQNGRQHIADSGIPMENIKDNIVASLLLQAEFLAGEAVTYEDSECDRRDRKLDKILTSKVTGIPIMILLLMLVFWITITGANVPSALLADGLFWVQDWLIDSTTAVGMPAWIQGMLILGIYRTLAWVVSVMLPPMAIFFPLFTLLEDFGYLPRVAFNLDKYFKKACACGKQALSMCMGFGCNAAGVIGCRIIDSPRERLIAIITNNFVPCNGRFPTLIAIISMFFVGMVASPFQSLFSALLLTGIIVLGVLMTFFVSRLLSHTILKGIPSSFTLELPPYRKPQIGRVIVHSIFDRTLFVLARAVIVAAPAGLIIWIMANIQIGNVSILAHCTQFLDPFARLLGLDGVILMAFILGFPANEVVVPIMIMAYMATGSIMDFDSLEQLKQLFVNNGWTWLTAVCTMLFSLMHWPCSTTCLTIKKETQSLKWTAVSFLVPTATGIVICFIVASAARLLQLV